MLIERRCKTLGGNFKTAGTMLRSSRNYKKFNHKYINKNDNYSNHKRKFDTKTVGTNGFETREVHVTTEEQYPQILAIQFTRTS
jgi:hypothetical protein